MGDFFKPWRRKIGIVTLMLACVFAAGWVRSQYKADVFIMPLNESSNGVISSRNGEIQWATAEFNHIGKPYEPDGLTELKNLPTVLRSVPYWPIVIPLTLLSAWLLLSKPRQSKSNTPTKLISAEGP